MTWDDLAGALTGTLLMPDAPAFAAAATGQNLNHPHRPAVVVLPADERDVELTVREATRAGVPVRVQATGHGSSRPFDDGVLVVPTALDTVEVDAATGTARIGAGVRWGAVIAAAAPHGLAPVAGASASVGVVGFLLGGGIGPLVRSHGFGSDWVRSFRLVGADGAAREIDATHEPELFAALLGGKGGFGIVTEVTIALAPVPDLYAGSFMVDAVHAPTLLTGWLDWTRTAPAGVTTGIALVRFPDLDVVPQPLRGRHLASVRFTAPVDAETGAALAAPLRALAPIELDDLGPLPLDQVARIHNDPTEPGFSWGRGSALVDPDAAFVDALLGHVGPGVESPFIAVELRHVGGAPRPDRVDSVGGRDLDYLMLVIGAPVPELQATVLPAVYAGLAASVAGYVADGLPINWVEDAGDETARAKAWDAATRERLDAVRAAVDPTRVFPYPN